MTKREKTSSRNGLLLTLRVVDSRSFTLEEAMGSGKEEAFMHHNATAHGLALERHCHLVWELTPSGVTAISNTSNYIGVRNGHHCQQHSNCHREVHLYVVFFRQGTPFINCQLARG